MNTNLAARASAPAVSNVIRHQLIPWSQKDTEKRFIVAGTDMHADDLPEGVGLSRRRIAGKRVVVKNRRSYRNVRNIIAEWPASGLQELNKYLLICVLDGFIDYQLGHYRLQCGPGHFIFIPPGTPRPNGTRTYVDLQKGSSCEIITFLLHSNALELWMTRGHPTGTERYNCCLVTYPRLNSLFKTLLEEVIEKQEHSRSVGASLLSACLKVLQREADAGRLQSIRVRNLQHENESETKPSSQADFATQLEQYVQANLRNHLTLERAARDMYLSRAQFVRNVRRETGESFNDLVVRLRLKEARVLLRDSEWTILAIAEMVGFQSASYFSTFFKQHTGESPSRFREISGRSDSKLKE